MEQSYLRIRLKRCYNFQPCSSKSAQLDWSNGIFTKPNYNLCMEERLTIPKKIRDKNVTLMNKNVERYRDFRHKITFHKFFLSTDDTV